MDDLQSETASVVHCLECGASLPADARRCDKCGNERLILPSRWVPPGEEQKARRVRSAWLSDDARVMVGLTIALFCALALLGGARHRTEVRLAGKTARVVPPAVQQVGRSTPPAVPEEFPVEPTSLPLSDIVALRTAARTADALGTPSDAANAWTAVTTKPEATLSDFLALADALERAQDTDATVEALNRAIVRFPDKPDGYLALGAYRERTGNLNAARVQYNVGLSYCPDHPRLAGALSRCERALGMSPPESPGGLQEYVAGVSTIEGTPLGADLSSVHLESPTNQPSNNGEEPAGQQPNRPVTLIGEGSGSPASADGGEETYSGPVVEVKDLRVEATSDQVTVELITDGPPELSSRSATDPPRLIVRLPYTRIVRGSSFPTSVALNVPLVDRVVIAETSDDSIVTVLLVIYMGSGTRYTVGSDAQSVRVIISAAPKG